jgi:hypothetical protein
LPETSSQIRDQIEETVEKVVKRDLAPTSDIGLAVHQYASSTKPGLRVDIDLTGLSLAQFAWLMQLSDDDLKKLAEAGPQACERAVSGKRCGIVGLPLPQPIPEPKVELDPRDRIRALMRERTIENGRRQYAAAA